MASGDLARALSAALGPDAVSTDVADHLHDITEHPAGEACVVVRPRSTEEVVEVVRVTAERGVSLTPVVAGYNVAGIAIPQGGVVVDLTAMDRIVQVDDDAWYALIEPGVTFGQLKAHLDEHHPDLVYTYPFAPPFTSVLANALLDGLNNLSLPRGAMGGWLNGVEAVLADATVVRTGAGAVTGRWFSRAPVPDLTGLFVSTQGTTGIVTRGAVQLVPKPPHRRRWFAFAYDLESVDRAMRALARTQSLDDVGVMTWPSARMLFGATDDLERQPDEPYAFLFLDMTGATPAELDARVVMVRRILGEAGVESPFEVEHLVRMMPHMSKLAELPTTLDFLLDHPGGGLAWVGSYGPPDRWLDGAEAGLALMEEAGYPPFLVARPMDGGRYHVLRYVVVFDREDADEVAGVRRLMGRLADCVLDHGYVPYKASGDAATRILDRADPGFGSLLARVRDALDPERRMNPGRWPGT